MNLSKTLKILFAVLFLFFSLSTWAQTGNRYALVIGNADYQRIDKLKNTVNDAQDIGAALKSLGFQVDIKLNLGHLQMVDAIEAFTVKLTSSKTSEGFFWYAGHAVQIQDENYLLPVDITVDTISRVRAGSFSLNNLIEMLDGAKNKVNVLILDACRDNPLPASGRGGGGRGLAMIRDVPSDLFVMFSTAPGEKADDGAAGKRNSPFAEAFLKNIKSTEPVYQMAIDVTQETLKLTSQRQRPYQRGSIISEKYYSLNPQTTIPTPKPTPGQTAVPANMVRIQGGTFTMGSARNEANRDRDETQHQVTVSSFYMGAKEVTLSEYLKVMQFNPNGFTQGANMPVIGVNWYNAIEYCNARSIAEGLTPAYIIDYSRKDPNNRNNDDIYSYFVSWDKSANGYRLPTEAEWEYACRAGTTSAFSNGSSITDSQAVFRSGTVFPVGNFSPNKWGLYDMHGNVNEWCWDWYGEYNTSVQTDPSGPISGKWRVARGGSWFNNNEKHLRSAYRFTFTPTWYYDNMGIRLVRTIIQGQEPQPSASTTYPDYSLINAKRRSSQISWQVGSFLSQNNAQYCVYLLKIAGIDTSSIVIEATGRFFRVTIDENLYGTMRILLYQAGFRDVFKRSLRPRYQF